MAAMTFMIRRVLQPRDSIAFVSLQRDFALDSETRTALEHLKGNPNVSLYAFDLPARQAVFVEVPEQASVLDRSLPLFYQQQRALAHRVHVVKLGDLHNMSSDAPLDKDRVLFLYSTGRCGSTLLVDILSRASKTVVLSEPDMFTQLRSHDISEDERQALARSATSLLVGRFGAGGARVVFKFRSQVCQLWPSLDAALSNPPSLFMYRNAIDVVQSFDSMNDSMRGMSKWMVRSPMLSTLAQAWRDRRLSRMAQARDEEFASILINCRPADIVARCGWHGVLLLRWLKYVDAYARARERSPESLVALRYEDLIRDQAATIGALFARFGWPQDEVEHCCKATQRHSQENTRLAASGAPRRLDRQSIDVMLEVVRRHSRLGDAHAVLPGTLEPSARFRRGGHTN
jgi:hypothetical protein